MIEKYFYTFNNYYQSVQPILQPIEFRSFVSAFIATFHALTTQTALNLKQRFVKFKTKGKLASSSKSLQIQSKVCLLTIR